MAGIKETKEVLDLVEALGVAIAVEVKKDGFQPKDLAAFLKSEEFMSKVQPAIDKVEQVPNELADLDFIESIQLARHGYGNMEKILEALGKK